MTAEAQAFRPGNQRPRKCDLKGRHPYDSNHGFAASLRPRETQRICLFGSNSSRQRILFLIVAMLTKLLMRLDPEQYRVHESVAGLATPFEHEHDDEHEHD